MSSPTIIALERAWKAIQKFEPEVPNVVIVTGRRRSRGEANTRGQHCADTWHTPEKTRLAEVVVFGERLADGGEAAMATLLHEAAHALATVRKVKDTSNKNRYHNQIFASLAKELTLEPPATSGGPALGYSDCTATDKTRKVFKRQIEALEKVSKLHVKPVTPELKARKPKRIAKCDCGEIPWSQQLEKFVAQHGPITHETCGTVFTEDELAAELPDWQGNLLALLTGGDDEG